MFMFLKSGDFGMNAAYKRGRREKHRKTLTEKEKNIMKSSNSFLTVRATCFLTSPIEGVISGHPWPDLFKANHPGVKDDFYEYRPIEGLDWTELRKYWRINKRVWNSKIKSGLVRACHQAQEIKKELRVLNLDLGANDMLCIPCSLRQNDVVHLEEVDYKTSVRNFSIGPILMHGRGMVILECPCCHHQETYIDGVD